MDSSSDSAPKIFIDYLAECFQFLGLGIEISKILSVLLITALGAVLLWLIQDFLKNFKTSILSKRAARNLNPEFDYSTIKKLRDIFIPTKYGRISPNRYDNPHEVHKHDEHRELIPFMINKSFNEKVEAEKFYLILADSGMGKTAFMVNLYMKWHSWFKRRKNKMKLFRFQPPDISNPVDVIDRVREIEDEEAKNTILLLDGLDEDPFIVSKDSAISDDQAFENRLNEIAGEARRFCDVVITCRTQYFPQQELQDYELNIRKPGGGFYKLNKYYLFPFSKAEVRKYLNKKYKFWNWSKKRQSKKMVKNSHQLMSRPMLMYHIDDLVGEDREYHFSYQIYETLIDKWLVRESGKCRKSDRIEKFQKDLSEFTRAAALHIYRNWQSKGTLNISKEAAIQIAKDHPIELKSDEVTGKSMLTCDPLLNWKFAHKSIFEYFLAKECAENWKFALNFNFTGMDMAKHFYVEMEPVCNAVNFVKVRGGTFKMGDEHGDLYKDSLPTREVTVSDYYIGKTSVTQKQWRDVMGSDPKELKFKGHDDCPVENVSWNEAQEYIARLNDQTGKTFRLPTEAEWEYAARGGNKSKGYKFSGGDKLTEVGWYEANAKSKTHPVATKNPNELGLHDMSGNVWEWCQDRWHENYEDAPNDGSAWESGESSRRVVRGGSWSSSERYCRVAYRNCNHPERRNVIIGFRLVLVP